MAIGGGVSLRIAKGLGGGALARGIGGATGELASGSAMMAMPGHKGDNDLSVSGVVLGALLGVAGAGRSRAIVKMEDELLDQAVMAGAEVVSGFRVWGNKGKVGDTFARNVLLIEAEKKGQVPLGKLVAALETEAKAAGAARLEITGFAAINKGFTPALAKRYGFEFRQVKDGVFTITKELK